MWCPIHMVALFLLFGQVLDGETFLHAVYNRSCTSQDFMALPALFGPPLPRRGMIGYLIEAMPANACHPMESPATSSNSSRNDILLIRRPNCTFGAKVFHTQQAGYRAAIVYNVNSRALADMVTDIEEIRQQTETPSVFTGGTTSKLLSKICHAGKGAHITLVPEYHHFTWMDAPGNSCPCACRCRIRFLGHCSHSQIRPLCRAITILLTITTGILIIVKYVRRYQYWRTRRKQLNEEQRKDLSTNRFNRGVKYTECAICLEPYKKGDLLKILSCSHGYHSKCIDLWHFIQSRNKTCPFCMQRVILTAETPDLDTEGHREGEEENHSEEEGYNRE
ncbi:PREDICTED: E3 ubiquitin-protein ligase RNF167-like [Crocodylus porosus]|uniref:E3 ubiquitin-protein ligase RNF167-like n=1 Tax=Crocodylus porosus TaxID=8502 RepID=UPI00093EA7F0|nr:PREDICTED: E3 ubiquitin-protein ligase RNF167-like [Crocodylus porosus]